MTTNDDVQARLAELQGAAARKAEVTVQSLLQELEEARGRAIDKDQLAAACRAIMGKAQLAGLLVERQQVEISGSIQLENCSAQELAAQTLQGMLPQDCAAFVTEADIERFRVAFDGAMQLACVICDEIAARAKAVRISRPPVSQYALEYRRPGNGSRP
jgi:hypothetical protein